jgi:hypothetical protein
VLIRILSLTTLCVMLLVQAAFFVVGAEQIAAIFNWTDNLQGRIALLLYTGTGLVEVLAICLIFISDREDYASQINIHRGGVIGALQKLWSIVGEHHGDAYDVLTTEHKRRVRIVEMGSWGYARAYMQWGILFSCAAILICLAVARPL